MKTKLLVINSELGVLHHFESIIILALQNVVPSDVLVIYDEDIDAAADFINFRTFSEYIVIGTDETYAQTMLEKYKNLKFCGLLSPETENDEYDLNDLIFLVNGAFNKTSVGTPKVNTTNCDAPQATARTHYSPRRKTRR